MKHRTNVNGMSMNYHEGIIVPLPNLKGRWSFLSLCTQIVKEENSHAPLVKQIDFSKRQGTYFISVEAYDKGKDLEDGFLLIDKNPLSFDIKEKISDLESIMQIILPEKVLERRNELPLMLYDKSGNQYWAKVIYANL